MGRLKETMSKSKKLLFRLFPENSGKHDEFLLCFFISSIGSKHET